MRSLTLIVVLSAGSGVLMSQAPPVKMGLWEKTMVTTDSKGPTTLKAKSCVTPAEWQEMVGNASKQRPGCNINVAKTAHGYSYSGTCTIGQTTLVMNGSSNIVDSGHITAESHSTSTLNGQKRQVDSHTESHFLSADCGSVEPGDPEIE